MKYFLYTRKSTEEDNRQVQSIETQEFNVRDFAHKLNLEIVETFRERKSAKKPDNRPLFLEMLSRIRRGDAQAIIVHHIDRLSRNELELGKLTQLYDEGLLKEIRTPFKTYTNHTDFLMLSVELSFASNKSRDLSERVLEGKQTKLRNGEYPAYAPIGYINKDKKIFIDPIQSIYIKRIYDLYSTGRFSIKDVTELLYKDGFRTTNSKKKIVKSKIHRILTRPDYYGVITYKGQIYKGKHEPIISKQIYDEVQEILHRDDKPRRQLHDFLYRGFINCDICKCAFTGDIKKQKYIYYFCTNGKGRCEEHKNYLREEKINDLIVNELYKIQPDKSVLEKSIDFYMESYLKENEYKFTVQESLSKHLKEVEQRTDRLVDMLIAGQIDNERYDKKMKELKEEKMNIELQSNLPDYQSSEITFELLTEFKNNLCDAPFMYSDGDYDTRINILNSALSNFSIYNKEIQSVKYKSGYEAISKVGKNSDFKVYLGDRDSNPN